MPGLGVTMLLLTLLGEEWWCLLLLATAHTLLWICLLWICFAFAFQQLCALGVSDNPLTLDSSWDIAQGARAAVQEGNHEKPAVLLLQQVH